MKNYGLLFLVAALLSQSLDAMESTDSPQTTDQSAQSSTDSRLDQLEQITVTGRQPLIDNKNVTLGAFGKKDAMDIPLTIQSFSSALLENTRARTLVDVTANDPSVQDDRVNSDYSNLSIRGFTSDWFNTIRRDGLNLAPYQDVPLEEVEQVTVLKGPSGFLYGFNSPGGTINFVTKRPTLDPFTEVTVEGRSYDGWYVHLDTSNTLGASKGLGYRINVGDEKVGDYDHNGDIDRTFVAGSIDWKASENAVVQFNVDYQKKVDAAQPVVGVSNGMLPPLYDPRTLLGEPWLQYRTDAYNADTRLDYQLNSHWSVTAQLAYSSNTRYAAFPRIGGAEANGDIIPGPGTLIDISPDQTYKTGSGQVFASGDFDTFDIKQELVTGVSWESYKALESGFIVLPTSVGNIFDPTYSPEPVLPPNPPKNHNDVIQSSAFASDLMTLPENFQALLGVRYIYFENTLSIPAREQTIYIRHKTVPNVGLMYNPTPNIMAYVDYTQGLQQSGVAPAYATNAGVSFAPLLSTQYEAGVKAALGKSVSANLAVFEITKTEEFVNAENTFEQDGRQRHRGVELSANGQITDYVTLVAGMSRLFTTQLNTNQASVNGQRSPNAPNWQGNLSLESRISPVKGLFVNGALRYVGNRPVDPTNTVIAPGFTTLDLGTRYVCVLFNQNVVFRGMVKNVADKRYWASADSTGVFPGEPRTAYLSAQVNF